MELMYLIVIVVIFVAILKSKTSPGTKGETQDGKFSLRAISDKEECYMILETCNDKNISGKLIIPTGVTTIGYEVCSHCINITSIEMHEKVKIIGEGAFKKCSGLEKIDIGEGVEYIKEYAFEGCENLSNLVIGERVKEIQPNAFKECTRIKHITLKCFNPPSIFNSSFENNIKESCIVYIPKDSKSLYMQAPSWNQFKNVIEQ